MQQAVPEEPNEVRYVALCYAEHVADFGGQVVAVVSQRVSNKAFHRLELRCLPDWQRVVPADDHEVFQGTFEDIETVDLVEADGLFAMLSELSIGNMQTAKTGTCRVTELEGIVQYLLKPAPLESIQRITW